MVCAARSVCEKAYIIGHRREAANVPKGGLIVCSENGPVALKNYVGALEVASVGGLS